MLINGILYTGRPKITDNITVCGEEEQVTPHIHTLQNRILVKQIHHANKGGIHVHIETMLRDFAVHTYLCEILKK